MQIDIPYRIEIKRLLDTPLIKFCIFGVTDKDLDTYALVFYNHKNEIALCYSLR